MICYSFERIQEIGLVENDYSRISIEKKCNNNGVYRGFFNEHRPINYIDSHFSFGYRYRFETILINENKMRIKGIVRYFEVLRGTEINNINIGKELLADWKTILSKPKEWFDDINSGCNCKNDEEKSYEGDINDLIDFISLPPISIKQEESKKPESVKIQLNELSEALERGDLVEDFNHITNFIYPYANALFPFLRGSSYKPLSNGNLEKSFFCLLQQLDYGICSPNKIYDSLVVGFVRLKDLGFSLRNWKTLNNQIKLNFKRIGLRDLINSIKNNFEIKRIMFDKDGNSKPKIILPKNKQISETALSALDDFNPNLVETNRRLRRNRNKKKQLVPMYMTRSMLALTLLGVVNADDNALGNNINSYLLLSSIIPIINFLFSQFHTDLRLETEKEMTSIIWFLSNLFLIFTLSLKYNFMYLYLLPFLIFAMFINSIREIYKEDNLIIIYDDVDYDILWPMLNMMRRLDLFPKLDFNKKALFSTLLAGLAYNRSLSLSVLTSYFNGCSFTNIRDGIRNRISENDFLKIRSLDGLLLVKKTLLGIDLKKRFLSIEDISTKNNFFLYLTDSVFGEATLDLNDRKLKYLDDYLLNWSLFIIFPQKDISIVPDVCDMKEILRSTRVDLYDRIIKERKVLQYLDIANEVKENLINHRDENFLMTDIDWRLLINIIRSYKYDRENFEHRIRVMNNDQRGNLINLSKISDSLFIEYR